ncbi:MAG: TonB-dependent receptor [Bacteroidota bacterium]
MKKTALLTLLSLLFAATVLCQQVSNNAVEKTYLQFDKPYYAIGDTIYFKAYVTLGAENKLSALSGILYAKLISPENKIARALKLQIIAGTASGDFVLTDTLKSGSYRVRAYTQWMRNEGEDALFEKVIPVGGTGPKRIPESGEPSKTKNKTTSNQISKTDIQFLPEGGSLIAGNYSRIALKVVGPNGLGKAAKGVVTDETGGEVTQFESGHAGMGSFTFVPRKGKAYKAAITFADGTTTTMELPEAQANGYTFSLNNSGPDTIGIRIAGGGNSRMQKLRLVAQACGKVYYAVENDSENKYFSATVPKNKFPTGIIQFTLLSPTGEPLNERLAFIENSNKATLNLKTDRTAYSSRQKINIQLNAKSKDNKPSTGSYSVAVIDEDKVPADSLNETNILTNLLLTSDLKGNVEQPNYYFTNPSEKTRADLDNLLLTQGYRHFTWKQMADTTAPKFQPESSITISGTVKRNNKPVPGAQIKLFGKTGGLFMLDTVTDVNGKFAFRDLIFADSTKFVVQSKVKKGQDEVTLELDTTRAPQLKIRQIESNDGDLQTAEIATYLTSAKQFYEEQKKFSINQHRILLKEITVEAKKDPPLIPHSQNLNGSGNADHLLTAKDIERLICARLGDCLQGVYNLHFKNGIPEIGVLVIDGNFVDKDIFLQLNPDDIEGIEIITSAHYGAIYGSRMANGGLIITTKPARRTDNLYYRYAPGVVTYMPKGFYKAREFYSPQYDNPHTNQKMADLRSTIYWNPNIITDKDGKASFSYFNADGKGTYRVVIEGIDADGNLGRQVLRYKVE